jgi:hypothetical protein
MSSPPPESATNVFHNWNHSAISRPAAVAEPANVEELRAIIRDRAAYPSPLRPAGHFHSLNDSIGTPGTQVLMNRFKDIRVDPSKGTITVGAFVSLFEIARALRPYGLQIECSPEIGNATAGSVACCGTKDASLGRHGLGQVSSCVIAMKLVNTRGEVEDASDEKDPERMRVLRSSYGLLGSVVEVTFRVQELVLLKHRFARFTLEPVPSIDDIFGGADGVLGVILPYARRLVAERRRIAGPADRRTTWGNLVLRLRNTLWEHGVSLFSSLVKANWWYDLLDRALPVTLGTFDLLGGYTSYRNDSTIDFAFKRRFYFDFTFWAVPTSQWKSFVPQYIQFCDAYRERTGFRMSLPAEVYFIRQDRASMLSFSEREDIFTIDLVHTYPNDPKWLEINRQFNTFVTDFGARPLLNQTKVLDRTIVQRSLGAAWAEFSAIRAREDADGRFLSPYFASLITEVGSPGTPLTSDNGVPLSSLSAAV